MQAKKSVHNMGLHSWSIVSQMIHQKSFQHYSDDFPIDFISVAVKYISFNSLKG